jgi:two-component system, NarL family, response regulator
MHQEAGAKLDEFSGTQGGDSMGVSEHSTDGNDRIRIMIADDHPVVRGGLAAVIALEPDLLLVAEAENGERAVELFREHQPDVVLMDLRMPLLGGVEAIRKITREFPSARVLALTTYEGDADIRHALEAGARGYLLKDMLLSDVITAIRRVRRGERVIPTAVAVRLAEYPERSDLTEREVEILQLVARGFSNKDTAQAIGRTDETVKIHLKNIFTKLDVADRTEAVTVALARGLIHLE